MKLSEKIEKSKNVEPDYNQLDIFVKNHLNDCPMSDDDFTPEIIKALDIMFENPVSLRSKYNLYIKGYRETLKCPICGKILEKVSAKTCGDNKCIQALTEKTSLEKYGTRRPSQSQQVKDKVVDVCMEKYGVRNGGGTPEALAKIKKTTLERYGVDNYFKLKDEKGNYEAFNKFKEKYGVDNYFLLKTESGEQLAHKKFKEKYNVNAPLQVEEIVNRTKETLLKKYGVDNSGKIPSTPELRKQGYLERYGVINNSQLHIKHLDILDDKNNLKEFIDSHPDYTISQFCEYFNTTPPTFKTRIINSNLDVNIKVASNGFSLEEKELLNYIKSIYNGKILENNRNVLSGLELDIYLPEKNLAIEFNGNYWHSSRRIQRDYHLNKTNLCKEKGIRLIHIFEYEWENKGELIKKFLRDQICDLKIIYARNCKVKEISNCVEFLNDNHLQGSDRSQVKLGLFYEDKLISVMTFTRPRFNKKYQWELSRYACESGIKVIGGAGKLLKYFERNYKPESLISYCDISKMKGDLYEKLGFIFLKESTPNYVWVNDKNVLSRYQTQVHKLHEKGYEGTEDSIMNSLGYFKLYDCGNYIFTKNYSL